VNFWDEEDLRKMTATFLIVLALVIGSFSGLYFKDRYDWKKFVAANGCHVVDTSLNSGMLVPTKSSRFLSIYFKENTYECADGNFYKSIF